MYIIAQYAAETHWEHFFDADPNLTGLHHVYSVHNSIEGCNLPKIYTEHQYDEAVKDCELLASRYPLKGYAVVRAV